MRRTTGYNNTDIAKLCFEENLNLFGADTEKHNLYKGLYKLASAVEEIRADIDSIQREVQAMKMRLG